MNQAQIYMTEGVCLGIAGLIIVILILEEIYGFRGKERSTISEDQK